jgi:hypothetical protein
MLDSSKTSPIAAETTANSVLIYCKILYVTVRNSYEKTRQFHAPKSYERIYRAPKYEHQVYPECDCIAGAQSWKFQPFTGYNCVELLL